MEKIAWNLRITAVGREPATVYVRKHQFKVGIPLQFDEDYGHITALEYALGALGADLVGGLQVVARKRRIKLDNVEAVLSGEIDNALTYLGVVGEEGHPGLKRVTVTVYVSSIAPQEDIRGLWEEMLQRSPLVRTLEDAINLDLVLKVVV